jgi:hemolysin activation/secretion protein
MISLEITFFFLNLNPSFGNRTSENNSLRQIKLEATISYLLDISKRSSIYLKNKTGVLNSENYIQNELFRIGGNNSIRGFNEQSIFVKDYVIQNIEYRYLLSKDAFIYSITDLAFITTTNTTEKLMGLGIGYLFNTNNAQINISTTLGNNSRNPINFKNTQLFINWINFF